MTAAIDLWKLPPDDCDVSQNRCAVIASHFCGSNCGTKTTVTSFGIAKVNHSVFGKVGMQDHIAKTALATISNLWYPFHLNNWPFGFPQHQPT